MPKSDTANWRRVNPVKWRKFKTKAISLGLKLYQAQEKAIDWFISKYKKGE